MNGKELINSGLLESYVLGRCSQEDAAMIREFCKDHPAVVKEIEAIEESLVQFASQLAKPLPPERKEKIAAQLSFAGPGTVEIPNPEKQATPRQEKSAETKADSLKNEAKVVDLPHDKLKMYKFGMAASLLLFVTSLVYNILLQQRLSAMNEELTSLSQAKSYMAEEMKVQQTSLKNMGDQLQVIAHPHIKTVALKGMNSMEKGSAMVHWNTKTHEVYFNAAEMPATQASKQYQLWAIVKGKPVDAGMIDMANPGPVFQKMKEIKGAEAFAVTIENAGGSRKPTMETMCLMGGV